MRENVRKAQLEPPKGGEAALFVRQRVVEIELMSAQVQRAREVFTGLRKHIGVDGVAKDRDASGVHV